MRFFKYALLWIVMSLISVQEISAQQLMDFGADTLQAKKADLGRKLFNRDWQAFPSIIPDGDGLGPVFNRVSCSGCHFKAGRGRPPETPDEPFTSMVLRLGFTDQLGSRGHKFYGTQINDRALPNIPVEGQPSVSYAEVNGQHIDGQLYSLRMPRYQVKDLGFGKLGWAIKFSGRVAQPLRGIGFLEAIPSAALAKNEDPDDLNKDGVSGRLARIKTHDNTIEIGRFGWKASMSSLFDQTAQALHQDMGLTNPLHQDQNCPKIQIACRVAARQKGPEVTAAQLDQLVTYQRALSKPASRSHNELGKVLFSRAACSKCHIPSWDLPADIWPTYLADQTISPYTDLLLHDMGSGLSDGLFQGAASPSEWRTAPLWGLTARMPLRLLHDGRARTIEEAILWHDGEARYSRDAFRALQAYERESLVEFLNAL